MSAIVKQLREWERSFGIEGAKRMLTEAADRIEALERDLADVTDDYLRRHKDACDHWEALAALKREVLGVIEPFAVWVVERDRNSPDKEPPRPTIGAHRNLAAFAVRLKATNDEKDSSA